MHDSKLDQEFQQVCMDAGYDCPQRDSMGRWESNGFSLAELMVAYEFFVLARCKYACKDGKFRREQHGPYVMDGENVGPLVYWEECEECETT